jgi:hypothetical protein
VELSRSAFRPKDQKADPRIVRDGVSYDRHLDRFFADLPFNRVRAQQSLRSYAYDLLVWVRFLRSARQDGVAGHARGRRCLSSCPPA